MAEIFPNGFLDVVPAGLVANLPTTPNVPPAGQAFTFYYATDTNVLYIWNPSTAAWVAKESAKPVTVTAATYTSPATNGAWLLSAAAGVKVTLPAATGTGIVQRYEIGITSTSAAYKIITASATDYLSGQAVGFTGTTPRQFAAAIASTYCSIQMPFAGTQPSGGFEGDVFEFVDIAAARWLVRGFYQAGTTPTTPFSTATT